MPYEYEEDSRTNIDLADSMANWFRKYLSLWGDIEEEIAVKSLGSNLIKSIALNMGIRILPVGTDDYAWQPLFYLDGLSDEDITLMIITNGVRSEARIAEETSIDENDKRTARRAVHLAETGMAKKLGVEDLWVQTTLREETNDGLFRRGNIPFADRAKIEKILDLYEEGLKSAQ